jgi:hypothetical protein
MLDFAFKWGSFDGIDASRTDPQGVFEFVENSLTFMSEDRFDRPVPAIPYFTRETKP